MNYDKAEIERLYHDELKTIREIGEIYGVSYSTMNCVFKNLEIVVDKKSHQKGTYDKGHEPINKIILTQEQVAECRKLFEENMPVKKISEITNLSEKAIWRYAKDGGWQRTKSMNSRAQYDDSKDKQMIELYQSGHSSTEIGKIVGLTHHAVQKHLKHNDIKLRSLSESQFNYFKKEIPKEIQNYEDIYDLYVTQKMTKKDIGQLLNVAPHVIDRVLKQFNIHVRNVSETNLGRFAREKHPNWKGGITDIYMILREHFAVRQTKEVLKRDHYTCQMCGSKKHLQVHHIKHFSDIFHEIIAEHPELNINDNREELLEIMKNDAQLNDLDNLITYCRSCHLYKVHGYKSPSK